MVERKPGWQGRLVAYLARTAGDPFVIGKNDCALWVAGAVKEMTGTDFARGFRGYTTYAGARKKLKAKGYSDHVTLVADKLPEVPPAEAQVGDVAVIDTPEGPALALVQGELLYVATERGRALVPLTDAKRAFRI